MIEHAGGKLTSGDDVLADGVDVRITKIPRGKQYDWRGVLAPPKGRSVGLDGPCRLEFDDGRSGDIFIENQQTTSSGQKEAVFKGSGPLE